MLSFLILGTGTAWAQTSPSPQETPPAADAEAKVPFLDREDELPLAASLSLAVVHGFVNVDEEGRIRPNQPMTHGDLAYILKQYQQKQQNPFE